MYSNDLIFAIVSATLLVLLLIGGVFMTIILANRRHVQQEIKMAQMELDYEKELRQVENEVQEQTLTNVSRELHDNIGQLLTMMRIQMEQEKYERPDVAKMLEPVDQTLVTTIDQVRSLSRSLNTDHLEQSGLLHAVDNEITRLKLIARYTLHWKNDDTEPDLNKDQKIMVFRIFQEIINNVLKHARARNIYITLKGKDAFTLEVNDDGAGFDKDAAFASNKSSGLKNIIKRAALANLQCDIDTEAGRGSRFVLSNI